MKRIFLNLASVLGGEAMVRAANLAAALAIARLYGPAILGLYGACLAVVTTLFGFADNGLQLSAITEIGSMRRPARSVVGELYVSKATLSALVMAFLLAVGLHGNFQRIYWVVGGLITLRTLLQSYSQLQIAILKSLSRMHFIAIIQGFHAGSLFFGLGIAFVRHWPVATFLEILVAGQMLELLLMSAAVAGAGIRPRWPVFSSCLALMRRSVPLGVGFALANLIVRLDIVVLSLVVPLSEIGQFSAADNLLVITYLAAWLFGSVLLPEMVQLSDSARLLNQFMNRWIRITSKIVVPAALLLFLTAPRAIIVLYGRDFTHAGAIASWMVLACPCIVWNSLFLHYTIATGAKRGYLRIMFATALSAVVLNYLLARHFGAGGVAAAILIRESLLSIVLWLRHYRNSGTGVEIRFSELSPGLAATISRAEVRSSAKLCGTDTWRAIIDDMETRCVRCHQPMTCNPTGNCWCSQLPCRPMPTGTESCLCRNCLIEDLLLRGVITAETAAWLREAASGRVRVMGIADND